MSLAGNTQLVDHGIQTEQTDLRFHVSVATKTVYVFEPKYVLRLIATCNYRDAFAYTGDLKTARGYLIPPEDIPGCRAIPIPDDILREAHFDFTENTSSKGKKAEFVVKKMIARGYIPLVMDIVTVEDKEMNLSGEDLIARVAESYQIKCDWKAGPKALGGTGNLYIQVAECNPLHQH